MAMTSRPVSHPMARLAARVSLAALLAGCTQSLFANPGDGSGTPDGGGNDRVDAGDDPRDGGPGGRDGGNDEPDASPSLVCPGQCLADAVADFKDVQGEWFYMTHNGDTLGFVFINMTFGDLEGTNAWYGAFEPTPAILSCASSPDYPGCAGVGDKLLFEATATNSPTLSWAGNSQTRTIYRISGEWRVPPGAPRDKVVRLRVVRNGVLDVLHQDGISTEEAAGAFDFEIDAFPNDRIRLLAISDDINTRVPLALSFFVSETPSPSACLIALDFPPDDGVETLFENACDNGFAFAHSDSAQSCSNPNPSCPRTEHTNGPPGLLRHARKFVAGSSLVHDLDITDYSGDFTVQFWAYFDDNATDIEMMLSDANCFAETGINVYRAPATTGTSQIHFEAYYPDDMADRCLLGPASLTATVTNGAWHFFRLSRSVETQSMTVCVDGNYAGNTPLPAVDMSADNPMRLGRDALSPAVFRGNLADVRVYKRALPCE